MTIAAIATPHATGGLGVIRISGPDAFAIAAKMFRGAGVETMKSHTVHLGKIMWGERLLDEGLLTVFHGPNSFTGEDVAEFCCHGGLTVCRLVLDCVLFHGARLAEAGEFTRRAFLNGRIDLSQAEAIGDLIAAQTENEVTVAANQLEQALSRQIGLVRDDLKAATAHLLATIDFSEEGVEELTYTDWRRSMEHARRMVDELLQTADDGRIVRDGVNVAIVGTPNVGKSSLLNAICGQDRAIVTEIAGTTRDVVEAQVNIRGCKVNLFDTAGIRQSDDQVEQIGIARAKQTLEQADLILLLVDGSRSLTPQDREVMALADPHKTVCLINKQDLPQQLVSTGPLTEALPISAATGVGLEALFELIATRFATGEVQNRVIVTNPRHKASLLSARHLLDTLLNGLANSVPFDLLLGDAELLIAALGEISGMTVSDEIIDQIFATFCVGK